MGDSLGDMSVSFSADISNLSSGIQQAQNQVSGFSDSVQSQAGGIGGFFSSITGGISDFVGGVVDGIGSMVDFGKTAFDMGMKLLEPDAQMEQMQVAFTTLMHSSSAAKDELQKLSDFAAKTPFQMMDLDAAGAKLLAFGEKPKEIIPDLTAMGDALSALGEATPARLMMVTDIFGKIQTQGKLTTGIMQQFSRDGINGWQALSDATGKSIPVLQDMVKHGLIPAAQGTADLRSGLEKMYGGGMAKEAQTFNGLMSTLKDNLEAAWRSASGPLFDAAKGALTVVGNLIGGPQFQGFAAGAGKAIAGVFTAIGNAGTYVWNVLRSLNLTDFTDAWHSVQSTIKPLIGDFEHLGSAFSAVGTDADPIAQVIGNLARGGLSVVTGLMWDLYVALSNLDGLFHGGSAEGLKSLIPSSLQSALSNVTGLFKTLGGVWNDDIKPGLAELLPSFKSFGNTLQSSVGSAVEQVSKIFSGQFGANMKFIGQEAQNLGKWFKTDLAPAIAQAEPGFAKLASVILTTVVPGLAQLWAIGQQVTRHIIADFIPVFEKATPIIVKIAGIVANGLGGALKFLMPYVISAGQAVGKFAGEIADRVAPILMHFWDQISTGLNWLETNWKYIWPSLSLILKGTWDIISGIVQVAWSLVSGIIKIGLDILSGNWSQAWTDLKDMLSGIWGGIQTIIQGQIEDIKGMFSGLAQMAISWGQNLISGFVSGITNSLGQVGNAMSGVVNTIGSFLPHSPAKQGELSHLNEYGPNFMKGFSEGITKSKPMLETAMNMTIAPVKAAVAYPSSSSSHPAFASYPSGGGGGSSANAALLRAINNLAVAFANHQHPIYMDTNKVGSTLTQHMKQVKGIRG